MGMATLVAGTAFGRLATASLSRAMTLTELVGQSRLAVLGTPTGAQSMWETLGGRRRIVTYTTLQVEDLLDDRAPESSTVAVRTLGGQVGDIGQIVHGEADLAIGNRASVFLSPVTSGVYAVTGMAQGLYFIRKDDRGEARLKMTAHVSELRRLEQSAVYRLDGRTLPEAAQLITTELRRNAR